MKKEAILQIINVLEVWSTEDLEETTDHWGECIIEVLEEEGIEVPEGMFNERFSDKVIELSKKLENSELTFEQGVDVAVKILTDYRNFN